MYNIKKNTDDDDNIDEIDDKNYQKTHNYYEFWVNIY